MLVCLIITNTSCETFNDSVVVDLHRCKWNSCHCISNSQLNNTAQLHCTFLQWMWPNPKETADLVIFAEEILTGKLSFFCDVNYNKQRED